MIRRTRSSTALTHGEHGQALTEFLVVALALVPLFLLIPVIAKYQDIAHATQMAGRYAAFQATIRNDSTTGWEPENELADEVRRRFFSNSDAPIKTKDVAGDFKANQNLFWRDPQDNALISSFKDVNVSFGFAGGGSHTDAFSSASDGKPFPGIPSQLGLSARGIYTANVSVKLANLPAGLKFYEPFDKIDLSITRSTSVVIDPWTAKDPAQVESKIAGSAAIFPVGSLSAVSPVVDAAVSIIDAPGGLSSPRLGNLDFWRDVVPRDRLRP
ncbi:hypothetical protein EGT07_00455 [Herbaspirillum sp. HC18]|nr:hypothetical protein EGT07_00455 [Herbaspirillum sp. HC18]